MAEWVHCETAEQRRPYRLQRLERHPAAFTVQQGLHQNHPGEDSESHHQQVETRAERLLPW